MKLNFILLGIGCAVTLTGFTISTTESRSQRLQFTASPTLYEKKDSILNMIKKKDDAIEMKLNKLEKQLHLLKKENRRINKLLKIKNEAIEGLQDSLVHTQAAMALDSSSSIPLHSNAAPGNGTDFF